MPGAESACARVTGPLGFGFCFDLFHVELFISAAFFTADSLACLTDDKHAVSFWPAGGGPLARRRRARGPPPAGLEYFF